MCLECEKIAANILEVDVDDLPHGLIIKLHAVDGFIKKARPDGELRSTQVIAYIVFNYLQEQLQKYAHYET